ncbi:transketolase [Rickettsiales endosymbiont of Peranema trichophorum]|uniref:transketolase n=1 Tax=Rickettsiales endosymbiont of Peranema trichophorum TaxID=2486577 RepID=UPI001023F169|nr:transketolase [Rickettsiales endosymbiont of Peranema trichophorum]RZI47742.1 transketolase [Rickettsiales endosymbiont of Peranema trichophorum]
MKKLLANAVRFLAVDMVEKAKSGHPGMPLGMADVITVLYQHFLRFNPKAPLWANRDRLILSAGHGSALLYAALYLTGYEDMTIEELKRFRQMHSKTAGHPEHGIASGVEASTGPLGQGLANAVGIALSERMLNARFGDDMINHRTYVIVGDGCLAEGISQEAISLAGHLKLKNLIVLFDDNGITIDGSTSISTSDNQLKRFEASNWRTIEIDGHDHNQIFSALQAAQSSSAPVLIACKTKIGYGAPTKEGTSAAHGAPLGQTEIELMKEKLGWKYSDFAIPQGTLDAWRNFYTRTIRDYEEWCTNARLNHLDANRADPFHVDTSLEFASRISRLKSFLSTQNITEGTRKSSERVIEIIAETIPHVIGGSADLAHSTNTKVAGHTSITADDYSGNYINYGVREHAMVAIMSGLRLHGTFIPYGGSFLAFTDYCRPAIRMAALMELQSIYVMTHDSIGLGEDGPTHQPIEQLAALRAMPNLQVFRPCDVIETIECWELALQNDSGPSLIALTRQNVRQIRNTDTPDNPCIRGAYIIRNNNGPHCISIFATGSEVELAVSVAENLEKHGIGTRVISIPCFELFKKQDAKYVSSLLNAKLRVAIEAGVIQCWEGIIGENGLFIGLESFGKSAPANSLFEHFGLTTDKIAAKVLDTYNKQN